MAQNIKDMSDTLQANSPLKVTPKTLSFPSSPSYLTGARQTRIEILQTLAHMTELTQTQAELACRALAELIRCHISAQGSGEFILPFCGIKVRRLKKKPTKAREMVSPLTGQRVFIPGKPARFGIKLIALKPLQSCVDTYN